MANTAKTAVTVAKVLGGVNGQNQVSEQTNATLARALVDINDNPLLMSDSGGHLFAPQPGDIIGLPTAPTASAGPAAGTGSGLAVTLTSTKPKDYIGLISITTGATQGTASSIVASVVFAKPFGMAPIARLTPHNAAASALTGAAAVFATGESTTGFNLMVGSTALAASTTYVFAYEVDI